MKIQILLETLNAPEFQRLPFVNEFGGMMDSEVICIHVTDAKNVEAIKTNGLKAYECQQGFTTRQAACYLFVDRNDVNKDTIAILGIENPVMIAVKLTGEQLLKKANYDGMFNGTFNEFCWSAIQYLDDIAPNQIVGVYNV